MKDVLQIVVLLVAILKEGDSFCNRSNTEVIRLTAPHGIIQTPGFPNKFKTPLCMHWIIDSQHPYIKTNPYGNGKRIRVYLTQVYLKENLTFVEYIDYPFLNGDNEIYSIRSPQIPNPRSIKKNISFSTIGYATPLRYFGVQVELSTPYAPHFRARNFLHVYGFNMTYEIVDENHHLLDFGNSGECTLSNCSFAGNCFVTNDYRRFFCDCLPKRYGNHCEYSVDKCDPKKNITFCRNGGLCKMQAFGVGICICPPGFYGPLCGVKASTHVKECPGPDCEESCDRLTESVHRPCSCHNRRITPREGWMRYEVMLQALEFIPRHDFRSRSKSIPEADLKLKMDIENSLEDKLNKAFGLGKDSSVTVISFQEASQILFQFFGPNGTMDENTVRDVLLNGTLSPLRELSKTFKLSSYPRLTLKKVIRGRPNDILKVGESFDLTCEAEGSRQVIFKWFKEGVPINPALATREIYEKKHHSINSYSSTSILMFSSSTAADRGVFTCQVSDMGDEQCLNTTVEFVAPPYVELEPMSLTIEKGEKDRIILCSSENESTKHNFTYNWEKNGSLILNGGIGTNEIIEDLDPYGSLLRILEAESSVKYSCVVRNVAGENRSSIEVRVLDSQYLAFCRKEIDEHKLTWYLTAVGQIAKQRCPPLYFGYVQRICYSSSQHGQWGPSNFSMCLSKELRDLSNSIQILKMGFANDTQIFGLIQRLVNHLHNKNSLYLGEGDRIISVLQDIGYYAIHKKDVIDKSDNKFLKSFLNVTSKFLTFPGSCSTEMAILSLINLIQEVVTKFPTLGNSFTWKSEVFVLEKIKIISSPFSHEIRFPLEKIDWTDIQIKIPNYPSMNKTNEGTVLLFIVFRNIFNISNTQTNLISQTKNQQLSTPLVSITTPNYTISHLSNLHVSFGISPQLVQQILDKDINVSCAGIEKRHKNGMISWTPNACIVAGIISNKTVECFCEHFGQFGLLGIMNEKPEPPPNMDIHWSVILGTASLIIGCGVSIVCIVIHIQFQFSTDSLYAIKLIMCSALIFSHLFILSLRMEPTSISLSTSFCSLLILSLSCQLVKAFIILMSDQIQEYSCLRHVSTLTILFGFFIILTLPVWTTAAILSHSHGQNRPRLADGHQISVLSEDTSIFYVFVIMISIVVSGILIFTFKAFTRLRNLRIKLDSAKNNLMEYRFKTIYRSLILTVVILLTILTGILHVNFPTSAIYQYLFGIATFVTGIVVLLCYTIKSEYPIPQRLVHFFNKQLPEYVDPEKISTNRVESTNIHIRTPEKNFDKRRSTSALLPKNQNFIGAHRERAPTFDSLTSEQLSETDTTLETVEGSSILSSSSGCPDAFLLRTCSVSAGTGGKRPSVGSRSICISRSMTNPTQSNSCVRPFLQQNHMGNGCCKKSRNRLSLSCNTNCLCSVPIKPDRGRCLLREIEASDYVLPSKSNIIPPWMQQRHIANNSKSTPAVSDLCPGYVHVDNGPKQQGTDSLEVSTFQPKFLEKGTEAIYETIGN